MKILKRVVLGLIVVAFVGAVGSLLFLATPLEADPEARSALQSDSEVVVTEAENFLTFKPAGTEPATAFIFYPGGRVDYRAYAVPLRQIAAQGYLVIALRVPLNLAILDVEAADGAIAAFPSVGTWAVGGHSLGGAAAALYAARHPEVDGLVLWASYPGDDALRRSAVRVISIYGTLDGSLKNLEASRVLLPADTDYKVIDGGNHSQFGDYGLQPGDRAATITRLEQQREIVEATVEFLGSLRE